jgi:hypothetical protein
MQQPALRDIEPVRISLNEILDLLVDELKKWSTSSISIDV